MRTMYYQEFSLRFDSQVTVFTHLSLANQPACVWVGVWGGMCDRGCVRVGVRVWCGVCVCGWVCMFVPALLITSLVWLYNYVELVTYAKPLYI